MSLEPRRDMTLNDELHGLKEEDAQLLRRVMASLPIMSDLSRSDLLICRAADEDRAIVLGHSQPHSVAAVYESSLTGKVISHRDLPTLMRVLAGQSPGGVSNQGQPGQPIVRSILPIRGANGPAVAALCVDTTTVESQRHRRRNPVFRAVLAQLQHMLVRGEIVGAEEISPFGLHDGILFVDSRRQIRYVSGAAELLFRKLGHAESVLRHSIASLGTDERAYTQALESGRCVEMETHEGDLIWIRKALPVRGTAPRLALPGNDLVDLNGVLLTVSDVTEDRRREQELRVKAAMIREIHHRVKNNLQTIISLLRIQSRKVHEPTAREILDDAVNRIHSVAVIHEFLSHDQGAVINISEVAQRIIQHTEGIIVGPDKGIQLALRGSGFSVVAQQATSCALIVNELLQNAVEHGFGDRTGGSIVVNLRDQDGEAIIEIADDGEGLPSDFRLGQSENVGLTIVRTLVKEDLKGSFELKNRDADKRGVVAVVRFPRTPIPKAVASGSAQIGS